jgi:hypothetical protein
MLSPLLERLPLSERHSVLSLPLLAKLDLFEYLQVHGLELTLARWPSLKVQLDYLATF